MSDMFSEAHMAVSIGIAERYLAQPRDMTWEDRTAELATAAIEAMQLFIESQRASHSFPEIPDSCRDSDTHRQAET